MLLKGKSEENQEFILGAKSYKKLLRGGFWSHLIVNFPISIRKLEISLF